MDGVARWMVHNTRKWAQWVWWADMLGVVKKVTLADSLSKLRFSMGLPLYQLPQIYDGWVRCRGKTGSNWVRKVFERTHSF
jgi:hypothetical protein